MKVAAGRSNKDSNLNLDSIWIKEKFGVVVGSGIGGIETIEKQHKT